MYTLTAKARSHQHISADQITGALRPELFFLVLLSFELKLFSLESFHGRVGGVDATSLCVGVVF